MLFGRKPIIEAEDGNGVAGADSGNEVEVLDRAEADETAPVDKNNNFLEILGDPPISMPLEIYDVPNTVEADESELGGGLLFPKIKKIELLKKK